MSFQIRRLLTKTELNIFFSHRTTNRNPEDNPRRSNLRQRRPLGPGTTQGHGGSQRHQSTGGLQGTAAAQPEALVQSQVEGLMTEEQLKL